MKIAEWKTKQSQPRITEDNAQIVLRRILLNSLMKAPVPCSNAQEWEERYGPQAALEDRSSG
jgi:hypothetical protein